GTIRDHAEYPARRAGAVGTGGGTTGRGARGSPRLRHRCTPPRSARARRNPRSINVSAARALEISFGQSQATTISLSRGTPSAQPGRSRGATGNAPGTDSPPRVISDRKSVV